MKPEYVSARAWEFAYWDQWHDIAHITTPPPIEEILSDGYWSDHHAEMVIVARAFDKATADMRELAETGVAHLWMDAENHGSPADVQSLAHGNATLRAYTPEADA